MSVDRASRVKISRPSPGFQVQHDAPLAAIDGVEAGAVGADGARHLTCGIARGRLDLDHVGSEVGEHHRAERASHHLGDVENAETNQGSGHW